MDKDLCNKDFVHVFIGVWRNEDARILLLTLLYNIEFYRLGK